MYKKVAFTMYPVKDIKRAQEFYENVVGLGEGQEAVGGDWVEFDLPEGGCFAITTMAAGVSPSSNAGGSVAFEVDDIEAEVERLKSEGVKIEVDTFTTPVCRLAIALDSEGNSFTIHQVHKK